MSHGGTRVGAGRRKVDKQARQKKLLEELLIPAFKAAALGDITVGIAELRAAYGVQGLADWRVWFEDVELGHGISRGGVQTRWRLKLKLVVAARKLLTTMPDLPMLWPSELLKAVRNKRAYHAFWDEYQKHAELNAAQYGTTPRDPDPFHPSKNYTRSDTFKTRDYAPRAPLTNGTKGYSELLLDMNYDFIESYTGAVPSESDAPF